MPDVSYINLLNQTLNIKDADAQDKINNVNSQIATINNTITNMQTKRFVLIADSLGVGSGTTERQGWTYFFKQALGLSNSNCYISQQAGYGWAAHNNGFLTLLNAVSATNPNTITDVICLGGLNDYTFDYSVIVQGVNNFVSAAKTKFPNAKIHLGQLGRSRDNSKVANGLIARVIPALKQAQCHYINGCENLCHKYWMLSDTWHLNHEYYQEIGQTIAYNYDSAISVGLTHSLSIGNGITFKTGRTGSITLNEMQNDGIISLYSSDIYVVMESGYQIKSTQTAIIAFANIDGYGLLVGNGQSIIPSMAVVGLSNTATGNNTYYTVPCNVVFNASEDNQLSITFPNNIPGSNGYYNGYCRYIHVWPSSVALNASFC